jgi:hypothetical protein
MSSTYLQTLLNSFETMDIEKLRFYLKDEYSYQDTTKEVFLNQIEKLFNSYKSAGDTQLLIHKGQCGSNECSNCGKGGYRFVGNQSKNYLDLLFITEGDDVTDIFDCSSFKPDIDTGVLNSSSSIYINRDDEISFNKDASYWLKVNSALAAYDEIITTPQRTYTLEEVSYWLKKHWYTNEKIGGHSIFEGTMKWTPFAELYSTLNLLNNFIGEHGQQLINAVSEIKSINDEPALIEWLLKYGDIDNKVPFELKFGNWGWIASDWNKLTFYEIVTDPAVKSLNEFITYCNDKHTAMLTKYSIYTPEEDSEIYNSPGYDKDENFLYSLKHHLTKRAEAREMGIEIPLFINDRSKDTTGQSEIVSGDPQTT